MGQFQSKLLLCIACNSLKSQQFHLVQICILLRFMSTFLVCTQFLTEKIIDKGENWISPRYASHTPNFSTNCMDPYTIRKSVFWATNLHFTPRKDFEFMWSYQQNKFIAKLLSATVHIWWKLHFSVIKALLWIIQCKYKFY